MNWIYIITSWIITLFLFNKVHCSGQFEIRLKYFNNENGRDNGDSCCSGRSDSTGNCIGTCKTRFRICLKNYQAKIDTNSPCTFGDVVTPVLGGNVVNLTGRSSEELGFINPIRFPFDFSWPGTFTLTIEAWHDINETNSRSPGILISRLSIQRVLDVSYEWTEDQNESGHTSIRYDFRVTCDLNYYGSGCANVCRPRDDPFGHYTCSANGEIVCLDGWAGDYCSKPRCLPGCDTQHGHCSHPNECLCQSGYMGALCDKCERYPGCVHGTCQKPWECVCTEGWGGLLCNQDLNYCTNHDGTCQNGGTCFNTGQGFYTCQCAPGFTGTDCDLQISDCDDTPCLNGGTCHDEGFNKSYGCECRKGWTGRHCEERLLTCTDKPCTHGVCKDIATTGYKCICPTGHSGKNCDIQMDHCTQNPCDNGGTCINKKDNFKCSCSPGFSGRRCEENIDDCNGNPCLNGGTCVDMVNQFRCTCVPGYIGANCGNKVDLCLTKPCANGGTCVNLKNDYECSCRLGFTGKDCSIDIDECNSMPCKNSGKCTDRVNSFHCECPTGFQGIQCDDEAYAANFDAIQISTQSHPDMLSGRSDGLSSGQVILIVIISVAMPVIAAIAIGVVICMKKKRKRAQEKDDAEARKQNEQNASATLHHGNSILSSKRSSSSGLTFDNSNPTIIKNNWDKSVNNISSSASMDECLMNPSLYGAMPSYNDNAANECYVPQQIPPLQRARSQKQLNTDPMLIHRGSQIIAPKEYLLDTKRISITGGASVTGNLPTQTSSSTQAILSGGTDATYCNQRWQPPLLPVISCGSPSHM